MEAFVDNIWCSSTALHFRICVVTNPRHRMWKREVDILLEDIEGLFTEEVLEALREEINPTDDPWQGRLFAMPESHGERR